MNGNALIAGFFISTVGFGFFLYGKKQARAPQLAVGLLLMIYPYFVSNVLLMLAIGGCLLGLLWLALRSGI
ncbi:MAG TPA: hypothetical protein VGI10_25610 [Polyangiaceae bacterium]